VRDVQLVMIATMTASKIRDAGRADEIMSWTLSEPHTVLTMWAPENGQPARPEVWRDVRIAPEDAGYSGRWSRNAGSKRACSRLLRR
jgi:hypothetical protein